MMVLFFGAWVSLVPVDQGETPPEVPAARIEKVKAIMAMVYNRIAADVSAYSHPSESTSNFVMHT